MADLSALVSASLAAEPGAIARLAALVKSGGTNLQALVVALGPQLTDIDENTRDSGTRLLGDVLAVLAESSSLSHQDLEHFVAFFADRLGDYLTIGSVLKALTVLVHLELPNAAPLRITLGLLEQCDVRSLVQAQRYTAMTILLELARSQWASLAPSACRVLLSTVRALDGEKDPRNLLLYLQLLRQLCVNCEAQRAAGFTEALSEVFDTLISYFPISFTPPPNDPHQITSQHLLQALLRTLRSSAGFAQHALPFFAAKLCETEDNPEETMTTRLQVLQSLALLAPAYGAEALAPHADTIGEALGDLFTPTDQQRPPSMPSEGVGKDSVADDVLSTAVRATLRALASVAGRAGDSNAATAASAYARPSSLMERLVAPSIARCVSAPPQGPGATPAALALEAIHQASPHARAPMLRQALPALVRRVTSDDARHADRADALSLLLAVLCLRCDAPAGAPDASSTDATGGEAGAGDATADAAALAEAFAEVSRSRCAILSACVRRIHDELEWEGTPSLRATASQVLCHVLAPAGSGAAAAPSLDAGVARSALEGVCAALLSARSCLESPPSEAGGTATAGTATTGLLASSTPRGVHASLVSVASDAARLRQLLGGSVATADVALRSALDSCLLAPLLAAFHADAACLSAPSTAPKGAVQGLVSLVPILAELSAMGGGDGVTHDEWSEGVVALVDTTRRSVAAVLGADGASSNAGSHAVAPVACCCLVALARLLDAPGAAPASADGRRQQPKWLSPLLAFLVDAWRSAADTPKPVATAAAPTATTQDDVLAWTLEAATPLWATVCAEAWAAQPGGGASGLLIHSLPWLLPPASQSHVAVAASRRLRLLLLVALVHTPRVTLLPERTLDDLLALATAGSSAAEGGGDGRADELALRCLCVGYNKWATPTQMDDALETARRRAAAGSLPWLSALHWLCRSAGSRGGKWTQTVPTALVSLVSSPPPPGVTAERALWWRRQVAVGVSVLMRPPAPDLRRECGAQLAPLLSHRLYSSLAPPLRGAVASAAATDGEGDKLAALLEALSLCLVAAPLPALVSEPASAVPHLLHWLQLAVHPLEQAAAVTSPLHPLEQGGAAAASASATPASSAQMDDEQCALLQAVLRLSCTLMRSLPESDAEPMGALLSTLLTLLRCCETSVPPARRVGTLEACVECLDACRSLPRHRLWPHKKAVLGALQQLLDHKKRPVRQAACRCANQWHLLQAKR